MDTSSISKVQTTDKDINQLQSNIIPRLNSLLSLPLLGGSLLTDVALSLGANAINHGLNRALQGWFPVRFHGAWAQIYDNQDSNTSPTKTLALNASAAVTVDLWVF